MKKFIAKANRRSLIIVISILYVLIIGDCAPFKTPVNTNLEPIFERALTKEANGIRVSTTFLGKKEARQVFGIDLARKKIQAVWIKIENDIDRPIVLLPTAIDPEYFTPLEVSFAYHHTFDAEANAALDAHLLNLSFPIRYLIQPGSHASGYVFTNWTRGIKVVDIDLLGNGFSRHFTFFVPNPDEILTQEALGRIDSVYPASELQNVQNDADLRQALAHLPCRVTNEKDGALGEPLNIVIIGTLDDWTTAFVRRGYRYQTLSPRLAFGRPQDISGIKLSPGYTEGQAYTIRIWQTPIRYQGKQVWIAQASTRMGGRFAKKTLVDITSPINPEVDEVRDDLTQDLAYSQALIKIGFVKGSGCPREAAAEEDSGNALYTTDGLRAVLVFGDRLVALSAIGFFDWERLADYQ